MDYIDASLRSGRAFCSVQPSADADTHDNSGERCPFEDCLVLFSFDGPAERLPVNSNERSSGHEDVHAPE